MGIKLETIIDAVNYAWRDGNVGTFQVSCLVFLTAKEAGYTSPADTGVEPRDVPVLLSRVAARLRRGS